MQMAGMAPMQNNPFIPPPQSVIHFAPFLINENPAKDIFREWKEGRWYYTCY